MINYIIGLVCGMIATFFIFRIIKRGKYAGVVTFNGEKLVFNFSVPAGELISKKEIILKVDIPDIEQKGEENVE